MTAISRGEGCCIEIEKDLHDRNDSWETGADPNHPRWKCDCDDPCNGAPSESIGITKNYTHTVPGECFPIVCLKRQDIRIRIKYLSVSLSEHIATFLYTVSLDEFATQVHTGGSCHEISISRPDFCGCPCRLFQWKRRSGSYSERFCAHEFGTRRNPVGPRW